MQTTTDADSPVLCTRPLASVSAVSSPFLCPVHRRHQSSALRPTSDLALHSATDTPTVQRSAPDHWPVTKRLPSTSVAPSVQRSAPDQWPVSRPEAPRSAHQRPTPTVQCSAPDHWPQFLFVHRPRSVVHRRRKSSAPRPTTGLALRLTSMQRGHLCSRRRVKLVVLLSLLSSLAGHLCRTLASRRLPTWSILD
jgi:hypothetical protein